MQQQLVSDIHYEIYKCITCVLSDLSEDHVGRLIAASSDISCLSRNQVCMYVCVYVHSIICISHLRLLPGNQAKIMPIFLPLDSQMEKCLLQS